MKAALKLVSTLFLPTPLRIARVLWHAVPFLRKGLRCLRQNKIKVELLDAVSISLSMIRRDFEIYRYRYMDEVELHHHDFYEIYMLLRGSVSYTVENRIFHMRAGDLMPISPLELHQARVDSND